MVYKKVSIEDEMPEEEGKYIVVTKTMMGNQNIFQTSISFTTVKGKLKKKWNCTNQVVTHWLKAE